MPTSGGRSRRRQPPAHIIERSEDLPDTRGKCEALPRSTTEKPSLQGFQQLAAGKRLQVLEAAVALRNGEVVLERPVRSLQRVVELVAFEEIVIAPRLVARAV